MKRTFWNTAFCCGLALWINSAGLTAHGYQKVPGGKIGTAKGEGTAKGKPPSKETSTPRSAANAVTQRDGKSGGDSVRGGDSDNGRGRGSDDRRGSGDHSSNRGGGRNSGRGGMHAPSIGSSRPSSGGGRSQSSGNRTPSFSQPRSSGLFGGVIRTQPGGRTSSSFSGHGTRGSQSGAIIQGTRNAQPERGGRSSAHDSDRSHSRSSNQPFDGNTVNFGDRRFSVGSSSYQPSYSRHSGYHGSWNGNRGYGSSSRSNRGSNGNGSGFGLNIGNGSGFGISIGSGGGIGFGINSGYGRGYGIGWGLNNRSGYSSYGRGYGRHSYRPLGWGLGGWGLGSLNYSSGYLGYSNPYYNNSYGSYGDYSYSQPLPVYYSSTQSDIRTVGNSAEDVLNNGIAAFQQNDYDAALDIANQGIAQYPDDAVLHEFRGLVLFARRDYQQAASTIYSVLAVGPGWDWTTLSSMYSSVSVYTEQLRTLEAFTRESPQDAASRFLLAYHYMSCGHTDAAARELQHVVKLTPDDRVSADLLRMMQAPEPGEAGESTSPTESQSSRPAPPSINPATLVGTWKASRADGSKFDLTLTNDSKFTWSFTQKGQAAQGFGGTYTVEANVLALERTNGGSLIAEITPGGAAKFNFKMLGAPDEDPGLDFNR